MFKEISCRRRASARAGRTAGLIVISLLLGALGVGASGCADVETAGFTAEQTPTATPTPVASLTAVPRPQPVSMTVDAPSEATSIEVVEHYLAGLATEPGAEAALLSFLTSVDDWRAHCIDESRVWRVVAWEEYPSTQETPAPGVYTPTAHGIGTWYVIYGSDLNVKPGWNAVELEQELTGGPAPEEVQAMEFTKDWLLAQTPTAESRDNLETMLGLPRYRFDCHWDWAEKEDYGRTGLVRNVRLVRKSQDRWWREASWHVRSSMDITPVGEGEGFTATIQKPTPYGESMVISHINTADGGGGGTYVRQLQEIDSDTARISGRTMLEARPATVEPILVVLANAFYRDPGPGYDPIEHEAFAYQYVLPGEVWILEADRGSDIYYYLPGWSTIKFEGAAVHGSLSTLPAVTLVPGEQGWGYHWQ